MMNTATAQQVESPDVLKAAIKSAAMLLIDGLPYRYGEFLGELQAHLSTMERGRMFFDIRLAVQELVDEGKLVVVEYKVAERAGKLIAPADFQII